MSRVFVKMADAGHSVCQQTLPVSTTHRLPAAAPWVAMETGDRGEADGGAKPGLDWLLGRGPDRSSRSGP